LAHLVTHKHLRQRTPTEVAFGAIFTEDVAIASQNPDRTASAQCDVGALVKAVYVELWFLTGDNQPGSTVVTVEKLPSGITPMTHAQSVNLHNYPNKNNLFYSTQGLVGDANTNPSPLLRQWILIPKGKQRMSIGDKLVVNITGLTNNISFCGMYIWKDRT